LSHPGPETLKEQHAQIVLNSIEDTEKQQVTSTTIERQTNFEQ